MFPSHFLNGMPEHELAAFRLLESSSAIMFPTGSRIICPDAVNPRSDWDIVLWQPSVNYEVMSALKKMSSYISDRGGNIRIRELNVICIFESELFVAWKQATDFCTGHPSMKSKENRIAAFKEFLPATEYEEA